MKDNLKKLQVIPGVGPKLAKEFVDIGIKNVEDLKNKNPESLYFQICAKQGIQVDKCVLYVCRSSVYFAENKIHNPEKLKWWNWKNVIMEDRLQRSRTKTKCKQKSKN